MLINFSLRECIPVEWPGLCSPCSHLQRAAVMGCTTTPQRTHNTHKEMQKDTYQIYVTSKTILKYMFHAYFQIQHFVLNVYPTPLDKITLKFSLHFLLNCQSKWFSYTGSMYFSYTIYNISIYNTNYIFI